MKPGKWPRLGDVIEVSLPQRRLAYIQYVNEHRDPPGYGSLIRVLPGTYPTRPKDLADLVAGKELYFVFMPVRMASKLEQFSVIGHEDIPKDARNWPVFKAYNENFETGARTWYLWDGKKTQKIGKLSPEHVDLSPEAIWTPPFLIDRLAEGWLPRNEARPRDMAENEIRP